MAPFDMLATAASQGGGAANWSWYVPVGLTALVIAVVPVGMYFRKTLMRWAPWLFMFCSTAIVVAAIAGVDGADELAQSLAGPAPKDFREYIVIGVFVVVWNLVGYARRRGRGGEGGGWDGGGGGSDDEGGGCDFEGD
jgi:hypothetical protein